ncbi:MAG: phosphoribosylanthranilate isomerase [Acidimicrobiales bacterium]|jgi:phosphoribosylanthranilate isomerase|nr:phosphoribosylanthranilate isomerase [Acidimicrobiales bacterium]
MFVKVCGTTSEEDALLAVAMGADAVGFVFAPSPRQVHPQLVADIVKRLPPDILTVGVFRDEQPERIAQIANGAGLRAVQLHGHETPEQAWWVRQRVPFLIQAFASGDPTIGRAADYRADALLIDAPSPGSGQVFDWRLADGVPAGQRLILAGGLDPDNVADAIASARPWGVDAVTGLESAPGRKDPRKVRAFVAAAKEAGRALEPEPELATADAVAPYDWQDDE